MEILPGLLECLQSGNPSGDELRGCQSMHALMKRARLKFGFVFAK